MRRAACSPLLLGWNLIRKKSLRGHVVSMPIGLYLMSLISVVFTPILNSLGYGIGLLDCRGLRRLWRRNVKPDMRTYMQ